MKIYTDTTYREALRACAVLRPEALDELLELAAERALRNDWRRDWDALPLGRLCELQRLGAGAAGEFLVAAPAEVLRAEDEPRRVWGRRIAEAPCLDSLRMVVEVRRQTERIARLFEAIQYKPTSEEIRAGIEAVRGSMHNLADWYSLRQGEPDVRAVYRLPWTIIYAALRIDRQRDDFQRRLHEVYKQKQ